MDWLVLLVSVVSLLPGSIFARQPCNGDLISAENLLFVDYLRSQAYQKNLFGWKKRTASEDYIRELTSLTLNDECHDAGLSDRLKVLEGRFSQCGNCDVQQQCGCNFDGKFLAIQAEMRRQKAMIQRLFSQVLLLSQQSCSGKLFYRITQAMFHQYPK